MVCGAVCMLVVMLVLRGLAVGFGMCVLVAVGLCFHNFVAIIADFVSVCTGSKVVDVAVR